MLLQSFLWNRSKSSNVLSKCHQAPNCLRESYIYACRLHPLRQRPCGCLHICADALPHALEENLQASTQLFREWMRDRCRLLACMHWQAFGQRFNQLKVLTSAAS